jgi:L-fucose isomerase-like protein
MLRPRIGCYAVYEPPEEGWENWEEQFTQVSQALNQMGMEVIPAPGAVFDLASMEQAIRYFKDKDIDLLHALIITWSFDHYTLELHQHLNVPVAIRAIPGIRTGSIVGSQQLASLLADLDIKYRLFYGEISDLSVAREVSDYARACGIYKKLRRSRMAVIGRRTEGMTPTAVDELEIARLFGIRLIHYGLDELLDIADTIPEADAAQTWSRFKSGAREVLSETKHGIQTARNYLACKKIVEQHSLSAVSIGSYPKCQGTMCIPIAWLNEDGIPAGCEGDVNATINMLILSQLSDDPVHFGEMLAIDEKENSIVTSHCGCGSPSLSDTKGYVLSPVRLANSGVCIRFAAKPGPITFVNLVGRKNNYRMCAIQGNAVSTGLVFEGNPIKFVLDTPIRKTWQSLDRYGFGHHWMSVYAHTVPVMQELCSLIGMRGVFPYLGENI